MTLPASALQGLVLFLLMAAGFAAARLKVLGADATRGLSRFVIDFCLPALIVVSMQRPFSAELRDQALRALIVSVGVYALSIPLAFAASALYRGAGPGELGAHRFAMCFSNVAFMGFPVMASIFGQESLFTVAVYNMPFQFLAFSVGIAIVSGRRGNPGAARPPLRKRALALLNAPIVATCAGFVLFLLSWKVPEPLYSAMNLLGSTTTPLSMAVIGAILGRARILGVLGNPRAWLTSAYRLVVLPLLAWLALRALGLRGLDLAVPVVIAAMPAAANTALLASVYGGDEETASGLTFLSTALSLVTIPLVVGLLFR